MSILYKMFGARTRDQVLNIVKFVADIHMAGGKLATREYVLTKLWRFPRRPTAVLPYYHSISREIGHFTARKTREMCLYL